MKNLKIVLAVVLAVALIVTCFAACGGNDKPDTDATLKIGGRNYDELASFLEKIYELSSDHEKNFVFTISADKEELPASIFNFCNVL